MGDRLRNFFYPVAIFAAIATVWVVGWASSIEAKANIGYWSAVNNRTTDKRIDPSAAADPEQAGQVASVADGND